MGEDEASAASRIEDRHQALKDRLVDATKLHLLPQPEPLIAGVLDLDTLAWLHGRSGHGKSFVALDMAGHVVTDDRGGAARSPRGKSCTSWRKAPRGCTSACTRGNSATRPVSALDG